MSTLQLNTRSSLPAAIVRGYALEHARVLRQFESYGNENWLIQADRGVRFVLRRQLLNSDPSRIEFQIALQQHLSACGLPAAAYVETASGGGFVVDDDGNTWTLLRFVEGNEYDFGRLPQAEDAGRCLARFHLATRTFVGEAPGPEYRLSLRACWANAEGEPDALAQLMPDESCRPHLAYLKEWWSDVLQEWPLERFDALPSGWLHGDFHGRNLVFEGNRVAGMFDLDDVDRGPYVHDVAGAAVKFGRERRGSLTIRPEFVRAFIGGYKQVRPLSADEIAALPIMLSEGFPPHAHNYRYWRDSRGEDINARFMLEVAIMKALEDQLPQICESLGQTTSRGQRSIFDDASRSR